MDQRRPALGRRPWLALRRRARSLRRAFFAMGADRVAVVASPADRWVSPPLIVARSRFRRWRGLRRQRHDVGLVLAGTMVHGRGMSYPLRVIGVDASGEVVGQQLLLPGRFVRIAEARYLIELPLGATPPPPVTSLVPMVRR